MSPELPELPATHVRPAPAEQPAILDAAAIEHNVHVVHSEQEVRAINAVFADKKDEVGSAMLAMWGASVILDGLIEDASGQHGAGEREEEVEDKPKK